MLKRNAIIYLKWSCVVYETIDESESNLDELQPELDRNVILSEHNCKCYFLVYFDVNKL